jgi:2-amino-4-hydroxy-6-hydroxymethyldihydropteridine diphosphokinase
MQYLAALGGNLGANAELFTDALQMLSEYNLHISAVSSPIRTAPVGSAAGGEFLNAAALLESHLLPEQVLAVFHKVEAACGRVRSIRWGPRTLDLDLLLAEESVHCSRELMLPHPALWYRDFVLRPAAEIAGEMRHPLFGITIRELWQRLQERPVRLRVFSEEFTAAVDAASRPTGNVTELLKQETAAGIAVEWLQPEQSGLVFADVLLLPATAEHPVCSYPQTHSAQRTITLFAEHWQNAVDQLMQLCAAIGCTRPGP